MKAFHRFVAAAFAPAALLAPAPVAAQLARSFVSSSGSDASTCIRTAPCATFGGAQAKTNEGGEITCLDSGSFPPVTIIKSLTIDCTAATGSIVTSAGQNGVLIDTPGVNVVLRGLQISGGSASNSGFRGIRFLRGDSLTLENVTISNFRTSSGGVSFGLSFSPFNAANLTVVNSTISGNGNGPSGGGGIQIGGAGAGYASVTLEDVRLIANAGVGLIVDVGSQTGSSTNVSATRLLSSGGTFGITVSAPAGTGSGAVNLFASSISGNTTAGIQVIGANGRVIASGTTITGNSTGLITASGGIIATFGDNRLIANGVNGSFNGFLQGN